MYRDTEQHLQSRYVQVEKNCLVGEWIKLLQKSFNVELKLWLNTELKPEEFLSRLNCSDGINHTHTK